MQLPRLLLHIGGALNALFFVFHVWLGWQIRHWSLTPGLRALLELLNGGGAFFVLFLAIASLWFARDVLATALGRLFVGFVATLYLLRAVAETCVTPRLNPAIFGTCLVVGLLYAVLFALTRRCATDRVISRP